MTKHPPGPDDPGYHVRLKGKPPLDEWVDPSSPSWRARMAKERRRERTVRLIAGWIIGLAIAGYLAYAIVSASSEPANPANDVELCQDNLGTYPC